jgi:two-component system, cell cycle sensor histidine kinase and response regulator CckA
MNSTTFVSVADHPARLQEPRMVLVVDDDCALRDLFSIILRHQGYDVLSASSAPEALELVKNWRGEPIDLLITDLSMPQKNGDDLADELSGFLPDLKVIYVSGYSAEDPLALSLDLRNAVYLPKPTGPRAVQKAIRALFGPAPVETAA